MVLHNEKDNPESMQKMSIPTQRSLKCLWLVPFSKSQTAPDGRDEVRVT